MNNLSTGFPQVFHRAVDIFFAILFPPKHEHKNVSYFSYFPDNIDENSFIQSEVFCMTKYTKEVRKLIHRAKYFAETSIAQEMGFFISKNLSKNLIQNKTQNKVESYLQTQNCQDESGKLLTDTDQNYKKYDLITCVPADPRRFSQRGYHLPEIMAKKISGLQKIPFYQMLKKNKHTSSQTSLTKKERLEHVKHVFSSIKIPLKSNEEVVKILLVDDTITTGATLLEAKKTIQKTYPQARIDMMAFAGVVLPSLQKEKNISAS